MRIFMLLDEKCQPLTGRRSIYPGKFGVASFRPPLEASEKGGHPPLTEGSFGVSGAERADRLHGDLIPRNEAHIKYPERTRDEGNAVDGIFSAIC
jgi:hypothetical protein